MEANELTLLVEQAKEHDNHAIEQLYNQYHNSVYFLCLKIIKNKDDALDLVQDTFLQAFNKLNTLQNSAQFGSWLNQIAANKCRDFLKKKKPLLFCDKTDENDDSEEFVIENKDESLIPDKVVDNAETRRLVMEIIDNLPDLQRMTVMLYYYEEKSVAQIAEIMGCSENTVKSRLNYARKQIKEQVLALEKDGTKLYGVMPMLFPLIHNAAANFAMPSTASSALLGNITSSMAASASVSTAAEKTTASAIRRVTANLFKISSAAKITIGATVLVIAVTVSVSVATGIHNNTQVKPAAKQVNSIINVGNNVTTDKVIVSDTKSVPTESSVQDEFNYDNVFFYAPKKGVTVSGNTLTIDLDTVQKIKSQPCNFDCWLYIAENHKVENGTPMEIEDTSIVKFVGNKVGDNVILAEKRGTTKITLVPLSGTGKKTIIVVIK